MATAERTIVTRAPSKNYTKTFLRITMSNILKFSRKWINLVSFSVQKPIAEPIWKELGSEETKSTNLITAMISTWNGIWCFIFMLVKLVYIPFNHITDENAGDEERDDETNTRIYIHEIHSITSDVRVTVSPLTWLGNGELLYSLW